MTDERPLFVVGYMHSGTTLLLNVLRNDPDVYCPEHETQYFMHLDLVRRHIAASPEDAVSAAESFARRTIESGFPLKDRVDARPRDLSEADAALGLRRAMDAAAEAKGCRRWAEKTPAHVFQASRIAALLPDALFVELVRDPRDVLASKKTRAETVWSSERYAAEDQPRKHLEKAFDSLWDSISWVSAIRAGEGGREVAKGRWMTIRYEDLVADPEGVVSALCAFAGLTYSPGLLEVGRGIPADPGELGTDIRGVAAGSVGRFTDVLDAVEAEICRRVCGVAMGRYSYVAEASSSLPGVVARIVASSLPALVVRVFRRWRLGGRAYVAAILRSYIDRLRLLGSDEGRRS